MSEADRDRWNERYRAGAYADREHPSALLVDWLPRLGTGTTRPRALDLACGAGRNALYVARSGWEVDALDVSDVALAGLERRAAAEGLAVRCLRHDLEPANGDGEPGLERSRYDLVLVIRYTNLPLLGSLAPALRPGGHLLVELHLQTEEEVVGPKNPRFRVAPGALRDAAGGLEILEYRESIVMDPDQRPAALARLLARRPGADIPAAD